eukprot:NODE_1832_length_742_cov_2497.025974_g1426_i0.p2 GENE.NODE_1832_length_742_cov_2497.025974_g1426_i0~~NODE_1832_length_742_cov_2497.025974_g1426_i0.p2  ORF type:complete len:86 (-),score=20.33 NODE_1832_length_742_cov_2497.025974_g1426_i0:157-414(-)
MAHIKAYMKKILEKLKEAGKTDEAAAFQAGAQTAVKKIIAEFDEYAFYQGESMNADGMLILCRFSEDGLSQTFSFWKDGLVEEKC